MGRTADRDYVDELTRWEDAGATWDVVADDDPRVRAFLELRRI